MNITSLTPLPEVNDLLRELQEGAQDILGSQFVGMYLDGSLATGGFDADSDLDFVIITDEEVSASSFLCLQALHDGLAARNTHWATNLEGTYISRHAVRRHDPAFIWHPNIERGGGERLKMAEHGESWVVHRWVLREHGIILVGPNPRTLIDPVSADDLRRAMSATLTGWAASILGISEEISNLGYQTYTVLTVCRILYTLHSGTIASKPVAARWAQETLKEPFTSLIERAWFGRHNPGLAASSGDVIATLNLVRYALEMRDATRAK